MPFFLTFPQFIFSRRIGSTETGNSKKKSSRRPPALSTDGAVAPIWPAQSLLTSADKPGGTMADHRSAVDHFREIIADAAAHELLDVGVAFDHDGAACARGFDDWRALKARASDQHKAALMLLAAADVAAEQIQASQRNLKCKYMPIAAFTNVPRAQGIHHITSLLFQARESSAADGAQYFKCHGRDAHKCEAAFHIYRADPADPDRFIVAYRRHSADADHNHDPQVMPEGRGIHPFFLPHLAEYMAHNVSPAKALVKLTTLLAGADPAQPPAFVATYRLTVQ